MPARQPALLHWLDEGELDVAIDIYTAAAEAERALSADDQAKLDAIASDARARRAAGEEPSNEPTSWLFD